MKLKVTKYKEKVDAEYAADGLIRKNTNKPEYGSLMLTSTVVEITNGYLNSKNRTGFVTAKVEELEAIVSEHKLKEGGDFSALVSPHRIVILEKVASQLTDDDMGYDEKINPSTGEVLKRNGESIFRKTQVVEEGSDIVDVKITHNTVEVEDPANVEFSTKKNVVKEL